MIQSDIIPSHVFCLKLPEESTKSRRMRSDLEKFKNFDAILNQRIPWLKAELPQLETLFSTSFSNWYSLDALQNSWKIFSLAETLAKSYLRKSHLYHLAEREGGAVAVDGLGIPRNEFVDHLSPFGNYCPVNLSIDGELFLSPPISPSDNHLKLVVKYKGQFYRIENEEKVKLFISNPGHITGASVVPPLLPRSVPFEESKGISFTLIEFRGYCPVSFAKASEKPHRKEYEGLAKGDRRFTVEYDQKFYLMQSYDYQQLFMR